MHHLEWQNIALPPCTRLLLTSHTSAIRACTRGCTTPSACRETWHMPTRVSCLLPRSTLHRNQDVPSEGVLRTQRHAPLGCRVHADAARDGRSEGAREGRLLGVVALAAHALGVATATRSVLARRGCRARETLEQPHDGLRRRGGQGLRRKSERCDATAGSTV